MIVEMMRRRAGLAEDLPRQPGCNPGRRQQQRDADDLGQDDGHDAVIDMAEGDARRHRPFKKKSAKPKGGA